MNTGLERRTTWAKRLAILYPRLPPPILARIGKENNMGKDIHDKNKQVYFLKQRLNMFLDLLDAIDPEAADLEDVDRMISIIDELDSKIREFNHRDL